MKKKLSKVLRSLQKAPERKHYLEFVTAALSIPVLITVILLNLNNLNASKKSSAAPTVAVPSPQTVIIKETVPSSALQTPVATQPASPTSSACKKGIGPLAITYPAEGATITDNPVNFIISYDSSTYCSVVWSYRLNNGTWSPYSSNAPSIYNLPNGTVTFDLRVQSTVSQDQTQITRKFVYQGGQSTTPTNTPAVTATVSPTQ